MNFVLRAATTADLPLLEKLHAQCFAPAWDAAAFERLLAGAGTFALLGGRAPDALASFVLARAVAGECEILALGTALPARRRGLAGALVRAAAAEALKRGATQMFLEVAADNAAAIALYGALGFAGVGRRPSYYRQGEGERADALILRASLPLSRAPIAG